mgnify:FL=1|jgi:hypothetical protein
MRIKTISENHEWYDDIEWSLHEFHTGKIDSITCLQQLRALGMEEAYCEKEGYKDPDWQPRVLQGGLL